MFLMSIQPIIIDYKPLKMDYNPNILYANIIPYNRL